jgi:putative transposase
MEGFLPWLYLRGISTGDFSESLKPLLGDQTKGFFTGTISRLKSTWEAGFTLWQQRDLNIEEKILKDTHSTLTS